MNLILFNRVTVVDSFHLGDGARWSILYLKCEMNSRAAHHLPHYGADLSIVLYINVHVPRGYRSNKATKKNDHRSSTISHHCGSTTSHMLSRPHPYQYGSEMDKLNSYTFPRGRLFLSLCVCFSPYHRPHSIVCSPTDRSHASVLWKVLAPPRALDKARARAWPVSAPPSVHTVLVVPVVLLDAEVGGRLRMNTLLWV